MTKREPLGCVHVGETIFDAADGAEWVAGHPVQVSPRLAALRRLPEPLGSDSRIDLAEAWMADANPDRKLADAACAAPRTCWPPSEIETGPAGGEHA